MRFRVVEADLHDTMLAAIGEAEWALSDALPLVADLATQAGPEVDTESRRRLTESLTRLDLAVQRLTSSATRVPS